MKLYRNIAIVAIVVALLVAAFVVVYNIPEENAENTPATSENATKQTEYIDVFKVDASNIAKISVQRKDGNYTVTKSDDVLILSNSEDLRISQDKLKSLLTSCSYVFAESIVSSKKDDAEIYGFGAPENVVTITLNDGTARTVSIGKETVDKKSSYFMVDGDDNIYMRSAYGINSITPEYNSFIETSILSFDPTDYTSLTRVYMKKRENTAVEIYSEGSGEAKVWKMFKPVYADANTITLSESFLTPLASLSVVGVVDAKPESLNKYGLASPYAVVEITSAGISQKLAFGDEVEGYRFLKIDDYSTVYAVPVSSASFLEISYIDLMSRLVHLENIKNVSKVEMTYPNGKFTMLIDGEKRSINGKDISKDDFADIYQRVIGISFDSVDLDVTAIAKAEVEIKYTRNDSTVCTVSYIPTDDRNYLALIDNKGNSIVKKSAVTDVINYTKQMLEK